MRLGWGMGGFTIGADIFIIGVLLWLCYHKKNAAGSIDDRLDDLTEGLGLLANELLARTEEIMKIKDYMPEFKIEQNPLTSIIELITTLRNKNETNNNPRDPSGRYAAPPEIEEAAQTWEEVDVNN